MTQPEGFSGSTRVLPHFFPDNVRAVSIIGGVVAILLSTICLDIYRDLVLEGDTLWMTLVENIFPVFTAIGAATLGWRGLGSTRNTANLRDAAAGMLAGTVGVAVLGAVVLWGQSVLGETVSTTILLQLMILGGAVGFFYGRQAGKEKDLRRQLRRDRDLLRRIQDVAQVGGWEYDRSSDTVKGTEQLKRILGLSDENLLTIERGLEFYPPDVRTEVREKIQRCLEQGEPFDLEVPLVRKGGERRWVRIRGERREPSLLTGTLEDITERKEVSQVLEDEKEVLRRMYRITADHQTPFDEKIQDLIDLGRSYLELPFGFVTRISAGTQEITHARGDHPLLSTGERCSLGQSYCRKTVQQDGLLAVQNAPKAGWTDDPAYDVFDLDAYIGSKIRVGGDIYGTFCFSAQEPRAEPFTEREKTFVELLTLWTSYEIGRRRRTRRLEAQNQRLDRFASVVSHDLRNPLNVAKGRLQLATEALPSPGAKNGTPSAEEGMAATPDTTRAPSVADSEAAKHINATDRALKRMNDIIEDMLVLTWGRRETEDGDVEPVELRSAAEQCWPAPDTEDASLSIETEGEVNVHRGRFQQLLENIMRNAIVHGGPDVNVIVGVLPEETAHEGFFVEDDGPGIPKAKQEKVLESGYSTEDAGTGLGLSIARAVADSHGWDLSVTDGRDGGARFEIRGVEICN